MHRDTITRILNATLATVDPDYRGDANETAAMTRQLTHLFARLYETEYPDSRGRQIIPVDYSVPSGANAHIQVIMDEAGEAKVIHSYGDDLPMVDEKGTETAGKIVSVAAGFFISIQDLRAGAMLGRNIDGRKANLVRKAMERKLDSLMCIGQSDISMTGFANDANVTATSLSGLTGTWSSATAAQMQGDLELIGKTVFDATLGIHGNPDNGTGVTLVLPTTLYSIIASKRIDTFNTMTVLEYAKAHMPFIKDVTSWARLNTAGSGSVARIVAFDKSEDVVRAVIPQEFEVLPMQPKALGYQVPTHMRFGGTIVTYPKAMRYIDGC